MTMKKSTALTKQANRPHCYNNWLDTVSEQQKRRIALITFTETWTVNNGIFYIDDFAINLFMRRTKCIQNFNWTNWLVFGKTMTNSGNMIQKK